VDVPGLSRLRVGPDYDTLTHGEHAAVLDASELLDGLRPAGYGFALARVRVLTVDQLAARLDDRFDLLTGGGRTVLRRHQTLRAAIAWSHDLLPRRERLLFRRLSVFAGGFSLEAAEAVCAGGALAAREVLDRLTGLVDKSLVVAFEPGVPPAAAGGARYRLLETVRQYAGERLAAAGEAAAVRARHRDWYLVLAERAAPELDGPHQVEWLNDLEAKRDNLRAAQDWSRAEPGGAESELRLAATLGRFWRRRGPVSEGRRWLTAALARCDSASPGTHPDAPTPTRALALTWAGILAYMDGDVRNSRPLLEQSVALSRELGDARLLARALRHLGALCEFAGEADAAVTYLEEALPLARQAGDTVVAEVLFDLGNGARLRGDLATAQRQLDDALVHARAAGDFVPASAILMALGRLALAQGDYATARRRLDEGLAAAHAVGDRIHGPPWNRWRLARLALGRSVVGG
jgi:non-specific serine/threonine protein kinase